MVTEVKQAGIQELQWLERAVVHYHQTLLHSPEAQDCLRKLGINAPDIITAFRIGYADGTLAKKLSAQGRQTLKRIGLLCKSGNEMMHSCLIFPLLDPKSRQVVNLYGYRSKRNKHSYRPSEPRGIFNPHTAHNTDEVIIAGSVIDAAVLWSIGIRNVIPAYEDVGLTDEIIAHLSECRIRRAVLLTGIDEANSAATQQRQKRLAKANIESRTVELPTKHIGDFISHGGTAIEVRHIISEQTATAEIEQKSAPQFEMMTDGTLVLALQEREYRFAACLPKVLTVSKSTSVYLSAATSISTLLTFITLALASHSHKWRLSCAASLKSTSPPSKNIQN